ncbi:MAG TPA: homoserine kinase [Actinomycetota bacterium]
MRITVRVPASAANLGPGFDCFGLALDLCNEVVADTDAPAGITWEGEGADELPTDGSDLVSTTVASVAGQMGLPVPAYALHGVNRIPLERGLGSSSAAAVAGVVLASALLELGWHEDRTTVFAAAAGIEGHPDNAAPAVFGGFTLAMPDGYVHRLDPHPDIRPVVIVPPSRLLTAEARAALLATVPLADAVFNAAHAALAVEALTRDPSLLGRALRDRLHQDARLALVPEVQERADLLIRARIPVVVSGAGPSLLAFESEATPAVTPELLDVTSSWRILRPGVRAAGMEVAIA